MSGYPLVDPDWEPPWDAPAEAPPDDAIIGVWPLELDGTLGVFVPNPGYPGGPADPVEALVRLAVRGEAGLDQVQLVLRGSRLDVARNGDGRPLLTRPADDPDGPWCLLAASGADLRVPAPDWRAADLDELVAMLPADADVLLNPGAEPVVRLSGAFLREAAAMSPAAVGEAYDRFLAGTVNPSSIEA